MQLVVFEVNSQKMALDIRNVQEVIKMARLTPTPAPVEWIKGLVDLRGDVVPVIDLRQILGLPEQIAEKSQRIILIDVSNYIFGMIVDRVDEVLTINSNELQTPPHGINATGAGFTQFITRFEGELLMCLNPKALIPIELEQEATHV